MNCIFPLFRRANMKQAFGYCAVKVASEIFPLSLFILEIQSKFCASFDPFHRDLSKHGYMIDKRFIKL